MHFRRLLPTAPAAAAFSYTQASPATAPPSTGQEAGRAPLWPSWLGTLLRRLREREELRSLSTRERRDIGLTDYDVEALTRRPLWRP
jgi:uncharacterized protein YjiS (DUF1127 family)